MPMNKNIFPCWTLKSNRNISPRSIVVFINFQLPVVVESMMNEESKGEFETWVQKQVKEIHEADSFQSG